VTQTVRVTLPPGQTQTVTQTNLAAPTTGSGTLTLTVYVTQATQTATVSLSTATQTVSQQVRTDTISLGVLTVTQTTAPPLSTYYPPTSTCYQGCSTSTHTSKVKAPKTAAPIHQPRPTRPCAQGDQNEKESGTLKPTHTQAVTLVSLPNPVFYYHLNRKVYHRHLLCSDTYWLELLWPEVRAN